MIFDYKTNGKITNDNINIIYKILDKSKDTACRTNFPKRTLTLSKSRLIRKEYIKTVLQLIKKYNINIHLIEKETNFNKYCGNIWFKFLVKYANIDIEWIDMLLSEDIKLLNDLFIISNYFCDIEKHTINLNGIDNYGNTLLHIACNIKNTKLIELFLKYKAVK